MGNVLTLSPLVVDLDGTLVKSDLLTESLIALLRKRPLCLFLLPFWMMRGKAWFKHEVARRVSLDLANLPWRSELIDDLRQQRLSGRLLVLATGADMQIARPVADYLKVFHLVLASDGETNLCGEAKRNVLVDRFGEKGFDYASDGDGEKGVDEPVWAAARRAILVKARPACFTAKVRALRPGHWLKNLLLFVPLFAAHRAHGIPLVAKSLIAFVAFGLCASIGYLLNDLIDLEADRQHPHKRRRGFASGDLPLSYALWMAPSLAAAGCALGFSVSPLLAVMLLAYFALSVGYSMHVKRVAVLDVLFLAGLYSVRIMAGSAATGIWSSHWLIAFSTFFFFSLALVKRYAELMIMRRIDGEYAKARSYELGDAELLAAMGIASGYLAVLVLVLYISSDKAAFFYSRREVLWFLCPLLLYWISHVWLIAHRGRMEDDPVVFATNDRTSRILLVLMALTAAVAL
jgi:4-hydroxybenzoate polyprenyltransferase